MIGARAVNHPTLTEQRLSRIWARYCLRSGGPSLLPSSVAWLDCSTELSDIAGVLATAGAADEVVELFHDAAELAIGRSVYDIQQKEAA